MMKPKVRNNLLAALILILLTQSCAFEYESDIPPINWQGGLPPEFEEPLGPASGPYYWTCEGDEKVFYCRVDCPTGPEERVCYQLCVSGECGIYGMDDFNVAANVNSFIMAVHNWQAKVNEQTSKESTGDLLLGGAFASCAAAAATGLKTAETMSQQAPPEPAWLGVVVVVGFVASLGGCVYAGARSIVNSLALPGIIEDANGWLDDALGYWAILRSCKECEESTNER